MKFSFLMCINEIRPFFDLAIKSILQQEYAEKYELVLINDGYSPEIIQEYIESNFSKYNNFKYIKLFHNQKNIGLTKSLNLGINLCKGEFIVRQDDDDISLSHRIETQIKVIKDLNLDFATSRAKILGTDKLIPGLSFNLPVSFVMNFKNPFIHGTLLIKKKILNDIGNYDERFYYAQDYKLFSDLVAKGFKYTTIKEPLYKLNVKDNISNNFKKEQDYYSRCVRNNSIPN